MKKINDILMSRYGPLLTGVVAGGIGAFMVFWGYPGMCMSCFTHAMPSGALDSPWELLFYIRPELPAFIGGAFLAAFLTKEHVCRTSSSPVVYFFLGLFTMFGAKVFFGCTWRAYSRLAEGDWNSLFGIAGLIVGVIIGVFFLRRGFSLGRPGKTCRYSMSIVPLIAFMLLFILMIKPFFLSESREYSVVLSVSFGLLIGWMAQKSRYCTVAAIRNIIMARDFHLFYGLAAFLIVSLFMNISLDQFKPGFEDQPLQHVDKVWNFLSMLLMGLASTFAGGCPGRQFILSGEGSGDSAIFLLGMISASIIVYFFPLVSFPDGVTFLGVVSVLSGLSFCIAIACLYRIKID